jgi:ankyrin repeat protein
MSSNEILIPGHRSDQQHVRQGNDYQNVTVAEGGRAVLGNVYADNFSMNILDPSRRPQKTEQEKKDDFMKSLGFNVMDSRLATIGIAHRDTCSWLYSRAEYLTWQDPGSRAEHHGFLWIKGKPGAGKSTLMKHALHHAQSLDQRNTAILSFFFNARGRDLEKTTEGMYRSLLHQVYRTFPDRLPEVLLGDSTESKTRIWQLPILQTMLRDALLNFRNTAEFTCYIDALDECEEDAIRLAIEYFEDLGELAVSRNVKISICFASRHYPNITMQYCQTLNLDKLKEHHEDIRNFVKGKLRSPGITSLTHAELTAEISGRSSGVFLWAALVVQLLNKKMDGGANRSQLIADLRAVPAGIEDLLKSILTDGSEFLLPTLLWVLFSVDPLSASVLYLAIKVGAGRFTPEDLDQTGTTQEQMQLFILKSSKGLVEFSKGGHATAQFIHESVREHLLNGGLSVLDDSFAENLEAKSHLRLALWCQYCIELGSHGDLCDPFTLGLEYYALRSFYPHCEYAFMGGALQLEFLDTIPQSTQSRIGSQVCPSGSQSLLVFLLGDGLACVYLVEGLLRRQLRLSGQVDAFATTRNDAIEGTIPHLDVNSSGNSNGPTPLLSAMYLGLPWSFPIAQLLLDCGADPDLESSYGAPLCFALEHDKDDIVELLLHHGASPNLVRSRTAGPNDIVELLLHHGASPNLVRSRTTGPTTPLMMALRHPRSKCVTILLERGADPNLMSPDGLPLPLALLHDDRGHVESLLQHGADPNITSTYNGVTRTPLGMAISQRSTKHVKMLLEHGADPNPVGSDDSPLLAALQNGYHDIVELLLHYGAPPSIILTHCGSMRTSLGMAMAQRSARYLRILLEHGADANDGSAELGRSLTDAVKGDQPEVVKMLLEHGAHANGCGAEWGKPLIIAILRGQQEVVKILLNHGADVNVCSVEFGNPLAHAVSSELQDILRLLPTHGAEPDGSSSHRPLHLAADRRDESMARPLLESGADPKAEDETGRTLLQLRCLGGVCPFSGILREPSPIAKILLDASAGVSATDRMGTNILVLAAGAGSPNLMELLIDGGAHIDAIHSTRGTALMVAAESGDLDIVRLLIDNNAKVNESGVAHTTALIMAAKSGVVGVVEILLDAGADVNAIDTTHRTALIIAAEMGNFDIARLLVARGANLDMHGHEGVVRYLRLRIAEEDALAGHDGCDRMSD